MPSSLHLVLQYEATVPENQVGFLVARLTVVDEDSRDSKAWRAVYQFQKGNENGDFVITTDPNNNDGILKTAKVSRTLPAHAPPRWLSRGSA